eukprot:COSAG01_NODE_9341_length_2478_cov_1.635982_3_plen_160_part_00
MRTVLLALALLPHPAHAAGTGTETTVASAHAAAVSSFDVLVYGATPGGVATAVAAAREGGDSTAGGGRHAVALLEPGHYVGGAMSGGLGLADFGPHAQRVMGARGPNPKRPCHTCLQATPRMMEPLAPVLALCFRGGYGGGWGWRERACMCLGVLRSNI